MSGERGTRVNGNGELEYTLAFPTHTAVYVVRAYAEFAVLNCHAHTNLTGCMSQTGAPCGYLAGRESCWFDGTSLAPALSDEDAIYALMERRWPEQFA